MKTCLKCGQPKPAGRCKPCRRTYYRHWRTANLARVLQSKRASRQRNRETIAAYKRRAEVKARQCGHTERYRQQHPDRSSAYEEAHSDRLAAWRGAWERRDRAANPDKYRQAERRYRAANPEVGRAKTQRRRARHCAASCRRGAADIRRIYAAQGGRCAYCPAVLGRRYHLDHKVPLVHGGSNGPENICCACRDCNLSKGMLTDAEFRQKRAKAAVV